MQQGNSLKFGNEQQESWQVFQYLPGLGFNEKLELQKTFQVTKTWKVYSFWGPGS